MSVISMSTEDENHLFGTVEPTKGTWYPIETAPKDNTMVLLYASDREGDNWIDTGYWETYLGWQGIPPEEPPEEPNWMSSFDPSFTITHWMPLPEPPK